MAENRQIQRKEEDEPDGAPEWMVTFSDCMTLLLTFFVLLLSFSSFGDNVFSKPREAFIVALDSIDLPTRPEEAMIKTEQMAHQKDYDLGSEKPTEKYLEESSSLQETDPVELENRKVFVFDSADFFWGRGSVLSSRGKKVLDEMSDFLKNIPNKIMICELNGQSDPLSVNRMLKTSAYLVSQEVASERIALSSRGSFSSSDVSVGKKRKLEITIFDRGVFD